MEDANTLLADIRQRIERFQAETAGHGDLQAKHGPSVDDSRLNVETHEIGARVRAIRGKRSQADFARMIGCSQPTVGRIESGASMPDAGVVLAICEVGDVSTDYLRLPHNFQVH